MRNHTGVTFINIDDESESYHTYDTFGLILESTDLTYPEAKRETIDVPGRDGVIDLTGRLAGEVRYNNRTLTINLVDLYDYHHYSAVASQLASFLYGKELKIILDKDKSFYYRGRIVIGSFAPNGKTDSSNIQVTCDVEPFKYSIESTAEPWHWDPFNFYSGKITDYSALVVNGVLVEEIDAGDKSLSPVFMCSNSMTVELRGETFSLVSGRNYDRQIILKPGINTLTFRGNGTVTIDFNRRSL